MRIGRTLLLIILFLAACRTTLPPVAPHRFITYDDPQSIAEKARLVRKHHLGGLMYWEHGEDPTEALLDAIVAGLR